VICWWKKLFYIIERRRNLTLDKCPRCHCTAVSGPPCASLVDVQHVCVCVCPFVPKRKTLFLFRLKEFYKRVHAAAEHLNAYQQMRTRYYNHNVNSLTGKLSATDRILFGFDMSTLSWDHYFYKYLRGLRVYLMGNRLHTPGSNNNTLNSLNRYTRENPIHVNVLS